jgi:glycosyltransferase involved in cell wall biosynthesis
MKLSIITTNSEMFLHETIQSVLSQKGDFDIEYIVIDGGSTDSTLSIIESYYRQIEQREYNIACRKVTIQYISEKDNGMYDALAKGLKLLNGNVVAYINSDDFYFPNAFSTVTEIFDTYRDVKWLTGMATCYNKKGQIIDCFLPFKYSRSLIQKGIYGTIMPHIQQESTFWRSDLLEALDIKTLKKFRYAGDYYIWKNLSLITNLFIVQTCLSGFRTHPTQLTRSRAFYEKEFSHLADKKTIIDSFLGYLQKALTFAAPIRVKRLLNKNMIYYQCGQWKKR